MRGISKGMIGLVLLCSSGVFARSFVLDTQYENRWFFNPATPDASTPQGGPFNNFFGDWPHPALTNASTVFYHGNMGAYTTSTNLQEAVIPANESFALSFSSFSQPVEGLKADFPLGSSISPILGANTNVPPAGFIPKKAGDNEAAYYESPDGSAFWVPSTHQIISAQPNNTEIDWVMKNGSIDKQVYHASAVPASRPARIFWTEDPYDAPPINLSGLFPVIHYNSEVLPPVYEVVTNGHGDAISISSNVVKGVWIDDNKQMHAINVTGMFILEYYTTGSYEDQVQPVGIEVVEVLPSQLVIQHVDIGERLLPRDSYWGNTQGENGLLARVQKGLPSEAHQNGQKGEKEGWVWAIKKTVSAPYSLEIYWEHAGLMGVKWPYEKDWYSADWPARPQLLVYGENEADTAPVLVPQGITATLMDFQEPSDHVVMENSTQSFYTTGEGYCLMKYTTVHDIWFEVIRSVPHNDPAWFDPAPINWEIGKEMVPQGVHTHALEFHPVQSNAVKIADTFLNKQANWTFSAWVNPNALTNQVYLYSEGNPDVTFELYIETNGSVCISAWHKDLAENWVDFCTPAHLITTGKWQFVGITLSDGKLNQGMISVKVDDQPIASGKLQMMSDSRTHQAVIGAEIDPVLKNYFDGQIEQVNIWDKTTSLDELYKNRFVQQNGRERYLIARFPFDEGEGNAIENLAGIENGQLEGEADWNYGIRIPGEELPVFPGYLYHPDQTARNVNRYNYPTEANPTAASYLFGVNKGEFEVWWAEESRLKNLPDPIYYPYQVQHFKTDWPTNSDEIVIASGLGSDGWVGGAPSIYYQNDSSAPGYNPNEEHALLMGNTVYALRDDLNKSNSSEPFVLVDYLNTSTLRPEMKLFSVVETNEQYKFEYETTAGTAILPPMPVAAMPLLKENFADIKEGGTAWQDRKNGFWARAAGNDGGTADAIMHFYYTMQPSFDFPNATPPEVGASVSWFNETYTRHYPVFKTIIVNFWPFQFKFKIILWKTETIVSPVPMKYTISWPEEVPTMKVAETLTSATRGLPDIWNQLSVELLYQQSAMVSNYVDSVLLFDPVVETNAPLDKAVIESMEANGLAQLVPGDTIYRFPTLPPSLHSRIFFDPDQGKKGALVAVGEKVQPLTGPSYLNLNFFNEKEKDRLIAVADKLSDESDKKAWKKAIKALPSSYIPIDPDKSYVHAALAAPGVGDGYVTLAFNNSTNASQVAPGLPVSLAIFKVVPELYSAPIEPIAPDNVLAEQFTMRTGADFGGQEDRYDFQWRWIEPEGGLIPNTNFEEDWNAYPRYDDPQQGATAVDIEGDSPFTLADHYFAVRYRLHDPDAGVTGTNWSNWAYNLAPGWISRVMNGINPFEQRVHDLFNNPINPNFTMISQAGAPYQGPIALNMQHIDDYGLIQIYETVLERAKSMSLDSGMNDAAVNQAILKVVSRLNDLYMLLGNEAYADAIDPTILLGMENNWYGQETYAAEASGYFAFMNQVPTLLDEELALLRGRTDALEPSTHLAPIFNRLIWNYTKGIDGGEPIYALNYDIKGDPSSLSATVTAEDAKRRYPQGHGDAWGYYLSAMHGYYDLLTYSNFTWQTQPGAMLIGNADVSVDYFDERKFSEAAAAKAQTGLNVLKQTYRSLYRESSDNLWQDYSDSNTNRAWGLDGWASRVGQAAFLDWAAGNSLMLYSLTNRVQIGQADEPVEGIQKIDRLTTPELQEIASSLDGVQTVVDNADAGINPLGVASGMVPFDISPADIDAGKTHFEQIYDRALVALDNAKKVFDHAKGASLRMRMQNESVYARIEALSNTELDFHNRLIELYGRPYPDDIGPGKTYPQGYEGPDLINYQILDLDNFTAKELADAKPHEVDIYNYKFNGSYSLNTGDIDDFKPAKTNLSDFVDYTLKPKKTGSVTVWITESGLKVKPSAWTGHRPAQGELQLALSEYLHQYYQFKASIVEYDNWLEQIEDQFDDLKDATERTVENWIWADKNTDREKRTDRVIHGLKITKLSFDLVADFAQEVAFMTSDMLPTETEGISGPFPVAEVTEDIGSILNLAIVIDTYGKRLVSDGFEIGMEGRELAQDQWNANFELLEKTNEYHVAIARETLEFEERLREGAVRENQLLAQINTLSKSAEQVRKLQEEGRRLQVKREQVRSQAAQRIQQDRYSDMAFRMFRNDALQKYTAAFDLAARYAFMAAKAYDYETGLLDTDTSDARGSKFLSDIVKARSLGVIAPDGTPQPYGGAGDPGLADCLARMKADWDVVKTRFGFNNPDTETSRFSLRSECFRISPSLKSDETWRTKLQSFVVSDLNQLPVFKQYCRSFTSSSEPQPAIVIPFDSTVKFGRNFFGQSLAGGDNAYDPSHQATKIRSVGIWFSSYNNAYNTNSIGGGLSNEPRIYLVPAGEDVMRSPTGDHSQLRHWTVVDQAMPLPYNIGASDLDDPEWIPTQNSLTETLGISRKYASLRAYHDRGRFDEAETHNNARLVGRSVWNTKWYLIIPGGTLLDDPNEGIERFIYGAEQPDGTRDGHGVRDIKIFFQTYSVGGD